MVCRIASVELINFMSIKYGLIKGSAIKGNKVVLDKNNILSIYGQNGSGKSSILIALRLIKDFIIGELSPESFINYINIDSDECTININFALSNNESIYILTYSLTINRSLIVKEESVKILNKTNKTRVNIALDYLNNKILPSKLNKSLVKQNILLKNNTSNSFIFCPLLASYASEVEAYSILLDFKHWIANNLFVIQTNHYSFNTKTNGPCLYAISPKGLLQYPILGELSLTETEYNRLTTYVDHINNIVAYIIPGLVIALDVISKDTDYKVELVSVKGINKLKIKYESDGILKLISLLNLLIAVFNDESICLLVDEIDAGIFEYLFGEILRLFSVSSKGQLIFTSHNLRPLEVLDIKDVWFTSTKEDNKFIQLTNVKNVKTLREAFFRSILLGGQEEELGMELSPFKLGRMFRLPYKDTH